MVSFVWWALGLVARLVVLRLPVWWLPMLFARVGFTVGCWFGRISFWAVLGFRVVCADFGLFAVV